MFEKCCNMHSNNKYMILHNPKPISLSESMDETIKNLLWYAPNIDSYQAAKNDLIQDKIYDDFAFTFIMKKMGMTEDNDVKWINPDEDIDDNDWAYYENEICLHCQKIVISRCKSLSKTNDLLRCLRNCIAHGQFAIVEDYIIGFNEQKPKNNPQSHKKAIIKIKPLLLLPALESLSSPSAKEELFAYAFERIGYRVSRSVLNCPYDLLVEKGESKFAIEIKDYKSSRFIHQDQMNIILTQINRIPKDMERILIIDTARMTKSAREMEAKIENFRIIDINQIKEMLKDDPVDILCGEMNIKEYARRQ